MWENSTGRSGPQTKDDCSTGCALTGGLTTPHPGRTRSASSPGKEDCEPSPTATRVSCQEHLEREPETSSTTLLRLGLSPGLICSRQHGCEPQERLLRGVRAYRLAQGPDKRLYYCILLLIIFLSSSNGFGHR